MKRTILVADDERPITDMLVELLTDEGYSVRVVHDGASALIAIRTRPPDLLILDVAMPVMNGDEVLATLRKGAFQALPVIIATAGMTPERFLSQGATAVLPKPFDISKLLEVIEQHV